MRHTVKKDIEFPHFTIFIKKFELITILFEEGLYKFL
jgi:hypothetical protein